MPSTPQKSMFANGMHHVAIICSDYDRSKHFYVDLLGLSIIQETFRADRQSHKLDLDIGNGGAIELFSFPHPPARPSQPEACGLRHLAFKVDDLEAAIAHLTASDIPVEAIRTDALTHKRFTFFKDPDGLPLELYEV
ncbi:MAG: VOC family protein [Stenomitos frigidus ULC029]